MAPGEEARTEAALLAQARELVVVSGRASVSMVQRHLRVTYAVAEQLMAKLESEEVVSGLPAGGGVRRVLVGPHASK